MISFFGRHLQDLFALVIFTVSAESIIFVFFVMNNFVLLRDLVRKLESVWILKFIDWNSNYIPFRMM